VPLSPAETLRYSRQLGLAGFGPAAQERLRSASVLVVGAGGLACPALLYLAAAGVGRVTLIDPDTVDVSNLQRQVLYATADAGRPKALAAAERLRALNPHVVVEPLVARLGRDNALPLVRAADVVLDGTDNFATRYLINDACALAGRPFVYGAIQGFEGQVAVFNHAGGPDYRDLFPAPPPPGAAPSCAEAGVLGVLPGLVGALQATEVVKILAGIGEPLAGRLLLIDALTSTTRILRLARSPGRAPITDLPPDEPRPAACVTPAADEIAAEELRAALAGPAEGRPQLLDVREDRERALGAIEPSAHLPLARLAETLPAGLDPRRPLVVYCAGGVRSAKALPILRERHGFANPRSLRGGFTAWTT
jgi:adenylyltransferase/sulfurtransferase